MKQTNTNMCMFECILCIGYVFVCVRELREGNNMDPGCGVCVSVCVSGVRVITWTPGVVYA